MIDGRALRTGLVAAVGVAGTVMVALLSRDALVTTVALVGNVAMLVVARVIDDDQPASASAPEPASPGPDASPQVADLLRALNEPALLVRDGRVDRANDAALALLGGHVVGEDVRLAFRHPAAADLLGQDETSPRSVQLIGLGQRHWQMRVAPVAAGTRLVHLLDETERRAAERMRVDFVANASHELRTPLASILGYVETLMDSAGEDAAVRRRFLGVVMAEARRMQQLVGDLISLSRIEAGSGRAPDGAVDLPSLVREVKEALLAAQPARAADIALDVTDGLSPVRGDRAQLSQLLHNLIGNAMTYGRAATPIRVAILPGGDEALCLIVEDEGDGIPPEHLPRLTERFYRVDPGRSRSGGGTGLGLAIVKHIVERHRGRLDITSQAGRGTRVAVTLPVAPVTRAS